MLLARLLAFVLALVFLWAAVSKTVGRRSWSTAVRGYRLPAPVTTLALPGVPLVEAAVALLFFAEATRVGAALTLGLTAVFSVTILRARTIQGDRLPCGCFGSLKERDFRSMLARNTVLAVGAGALLIYGRDVPGYPPAPSSDALLPAVLATGGVAMILWLYVSVRSGFRRNVV